jgi:hypothetical protein
MIRPFLFTISVFGFFNLHAQIDVSKIIGKNTSSYSLGFGGFLRFAYPVSDASDVTLEAGANIFHVKDNPSYGWALIPVKAGYRYTLNGTGTGLYIEPLAGYNVYGIDPDDNKFTGLILAGEAGYLFQPGGRIQFDLGLLFESAFHKDGNLNYLSLRLSHNFSFRRRDSDY